MHTLTREVLASPYPCAGFVPLRRDQDWEEVQEVRGPEPLVCHGARHLRILGIAGAAADPPLNLLERRGGGGGGVLLMRDGL